MSLGRVYLAGPGVFRPDAQDFGANLRDLCEKFKLNGCYPMDAEIMASAGEAKAPAIYRANRELIDSCQAIVAEISPFRGPNMDPGTAWEVGYGVAKNLPVFAWSTDLRALCDRTAPLHASKTDPVPVDAKGWAIEDFGLVENLMIALSCRSIHPDASQAIAACALFLKGG